MQDVNPLPAVGEASEAAQILKEAPRPPAVGVPGVLSTHFSIHHTVATPDELSEHMGERRDKSQKYRHVHSSASISTCDLSPLWDVGMETY